MISSTQASITTPRARADFRHFLRFYDPINFYILLFLNETSYYCVLLSGKQSVCQKQSSKWNLKSLCALKMRIQRKIRKLLRYYWVTFKQENNIISSE